MAMRKVNRRVKVGLTAMAFVLGGSFAVGNAAPGAYVTVRAEDEGTVSVRDRDGKGHDRHDDQYADPSAVYKAGNSIGFLCISDTVNRDT